MSGQPPSPRHGHSATLIAKKIIIFGGRGLYSNQIYNDLYILDTTSLTWSKPTLSGDIPCPRYYHAAEMVNDRELFILGGNPGHSYLK